MADRGRAGAGGGARRPRRRDPPRRRGRRAALERRGEAAHPHVARARHAQPRGRPARSRPAAGRARVRLCGGLVRPAGRRARGRGHAGRGRLPRRGVRGVGARGGRGRGARRARRPGAHRASCWTRRAGRWRRCCRSSASASAGRWPAATSGCPGSTATTSSRSTCARSTTPPGRAPVNGTAPEPVTNKEFSRALGRALHRPAFAPVPGFAVRVLYGEMADIVVCGQRAVPKRTQALGFSFRHPSWTRRCATRSPADRAARRLTR